MQKAAVLAELAELAGSRRLKERWSWPGLSRLRKNPLNSTKFARTVAQGLKPRLILCGLLARMNPCPFKTVASMEFFRSLFFARYAG